MLLKSELEMFFFFEKNNLVAKNFLELGGIQRKKITRRKIKRANNVCVRKPRAMIWTFAFQLTQPPIPTNGSHQRPLREHRCVFHGDEP